MDEWLQQRAKEMRREPVLYERRLWKLLRDRRLAGLKFRRQVVLGRYIVDFICFRHRLIVEADGPHHEDRAQDVERDEWLRAQGFSVLRFPNQQIENRGHEVIGAILAAADAKVTRD
jgi:very-short-patch-repair endonuclease